MLIGGDKVEVQSRYRTVLKSSSMIGGAAMINILIGMVKTKVVAVLLGPSGVGLITLFNTVTGPIATFAGMGLQTSGVRQIATAHAAADSSRVARVVRTLRLTCWGTGVLGGGIMVLLSPWLCEWTFGDREKMMGVALLGLTILFGNISAGQRCVIQGTRRIKEMAKLQVLGALSGTLISIPLYYMFGLGGILPGIILTSLAGVVTSWWYARKVKLDDDKPSRNEIVQEVKTLFGFGLPLMLTGLQYASIAYFIRLVLVQRFETDGLGQWAAAFGLSGILVSFVLQAMGADYYPRLTGVANDPEKMRDEVNAQAHIALVLALPALMATLLFAPLVIQIFYSGSFEDAIPILRWSVFGAFGRVVTWPLGFVILAKGMGKTFFCTELIGNGGHFLWIWILTEIYGIVGSGMAWAATYVVVFLAVGSVTAITIRFRWSQVNIKWIMGSLVLLLGAFWIERLPCNESLRLVISIGIVGIVGLFCLRSLSKLTGWDAQKMVDKVKSHTKHQKKF